ncbi:MAG: DUF928 domain-containing protein [Limnospira sp.]
MNPNASATAILRYCAIALLPFLVSEMAAMEVSQFRPPDIREPSRRESGGTRGAGIFGRENAIALVPEMGGVTVSEFPSFFFYIPEIDRSSPEVTAFFDIFDENDKIYETQLNGLETGGIIKIGGTETAAQLSLEIGKIYRWSLEIEGGGILAGTVQRVAADPELTEALKRAIPEDYPDLYIEAGIWYDSLSTLAALRQADPDNSNLTTRWQELLESAGLDAIANAPLLSLKNVSPASEFRPPDDGLSPRPSPGGTR